MKAAGAPRRLGLRQPMLVVDPEASALVDVEVGDLARVLVPGDVVVVNDAATLPASLTVRGPGGRMHELRLTGPDDDDGVFSAIVLGQGTWQIDTDRRPPPDRWSPGDRLWLDDAAPALVVVSVDGPRRVKVRLQADRAAAYAALYRFGRPIQYAYAQRPVALHEVQSPFARVPWAAEMPSAAAPLRWAAVLGLRARGISVVALTHAAGVSATGRPDLDATLPWPERYAIGETTARTIEDARARGSTIVAVGTSTARALEGVALRSGGRVIAQTGTTDLVLGRGFEPAIVGALLSGVHEPGTSHYGLLEAFVPAPLLRQAVHHAERRGYLLHEFGDSTLVMPGAVQRLGIRDGNTASAIETPSGGVESAAPRRSVTSMRDGDKAA